MRKHDHTNQQGEAQQANYLRNRRTASPGSSCYQHAAKVGFVGAAGRTEHPRWCGERPAGWTDLVPELNEQPQDHRVTKRTWGAFTNTGLEDYSKGVDVTQTIIAGVATSIGVEFDRAPGLRTRLQCHSGYGRDDRQERRSSRQQPHADFFRASVSAAPLKRLSNSSAAPAYEPNAISAPRSCSKLPVG